MAICLRLLIAGGLLTTLAGCYYVQAARGQIEVLGKRQPLTEVIASPDTAEELSRRLRLVQEARRFSIEELGLPDNDSYRSYTDLERDYVLWNVFATPEFSLEPKRWCYPVVGCVSYRGYFAEVDANRQANRLRRLGYDVAVGGVAAYSTLGRFSDPVLSTMLRWDDLRLVAVLFHELAHQVLYIKDDTGFNESFATAVEEIGVERWLAQRGREQDIAAYRRRKALQRRILDRVNAARADLETYYSETIDADCKRLLKEHRLEQLADEVRVELEQAGHDGRHWLTGELNNARLLPMALYEGQVPAFRALADDCEGDFDCFYERSSSLAELDRDARTARLAALAGRAQQGR